MKNTLKKTTLAISFALCGMAQAQTETLIFDNQLEINGLNDQTGYQLKLRLPQGEIKTLNLDPSKSITFDAADFAIDQFQDGVYKYELVPIHLTSKPRNINNEKVATTVGENLSGVFTVLNGSTISDQDEPVRDQVILDDLIVDGSLCVGFDCVNGESFGFDTIRLKENNVRIKFQDTSSSGSFPSNDWQITANDSANGGANKFSIDDIDGGKTPFTIEASAPSHSLYVDDGGRIGLGTSTPVTEVHVVDGDTPTVRLEQNGSSGFAAQTWDLAGNETNFFVRDASNGSTLPFRIRPGAPTSAIDVDAAGNIGFGTASPNNNLHVRAATGNSGFQLENAATSKSWKFVNKTDSFQISVVGSSGAEFNVSEDGSLKVGDDGFTANFDMDSNGNVTIQGTLTQNSDVNVKENIQLVNTREVLDKVMSLPISVWNYKFDDDSVKHLGPMAQDFFKQFGLGATDNKIATLDTSGVALASIKELGSQLSEKEQDIKSLQKENQELKARLEKIESLLLKNK